MSKSGCRSASARAEVVRDCSQGFYRVVLGQREVLDRSVDAAVPLQLPLAFEEELTGEGLNVDDVRHGFLGQVEDREAALKTGMTASRERQHEDRDFGPCGELDEVLDLPAHGLRP